MKLMLIYSRGWIRRLSPSGLCPEGRALRGFRPNLRSGPPGAAPIPDRLPGVLFFCLLLMILYIKVQLLQLSFSIPLFFRYMVSPVSLITKGS